VRPQIQLGRIAGIQVGLHYSWFLIALLIAFSLANHFHAVSPNQSVAWVWTISIITSVLFFICLLLHELAHSLVAKSRGLKVRAITLFALGGVSQIDSESPNASTEFWIAIVGPLASILIGALCVSIARVTGWSSEGEPSNSALAILLWLGYINIGLGVFNMIPGYPLDGGRVLRAIAWWITHSADRATRLAAQIGQVVAFLFIILGLYRFFVGSNSGGLWMAFIGWFLLDAARSSYLQVGLVSGLRGHFVSELMERNCATVPAYISIRDFVDEYLVHSSNPCFIVVQDNHPIGIATPEVAKKVSRDRWPQTSLQSVMRRLDRMVQIPPDTPALKALEMLAQESVDEAAVISNGELQGIFSRKQVSRYLQLHTGLDQPLDRAA
jgi:Zn-dependent protease